MKTPYLILHFVHAPCRKPSFFFQIFYDFQKSDWQEINLWSQDGDDRYQIKATVWILAWT
jgi:hypothetical protein